MQTLIDQVYKRLPPKNESNLILGVVVFVVHTWSMRNFLHKVPSFLLYTSLTDTFAVLCYMMAFALLESLAITAGMMLLSMLLPPAWFRDGFAYKGFVMVLVCTIASIWLQQTIGSEFPSKALLYVLAVVILLAVTGLCLLIYKFPVLQKFVFEVEDRISIMQYIYIPLGLLGLLVVFIRNIF